MILPKIEERLGESEASICRAKQYNVHRSPKIFQLRAYPTDYGARMSKGKVRVREESVLMPYIANTFAVKLCYNPAD